MGGSSRSVGRVGIGRSMGELPVCGVGGMRAKNISVRAKGGLGKMRP